MEAQTIELQMQAMFVALCVHYHARINHFFTLSLLSHWHQEIMFCSENIFSLLVVDKSQIESTRVTDTMPEIRLYRKNDNQWKQGAEKVKTLVTSMCFEFAIMTHMNVMHIMFGNTLTY